MLERGEQGVELGEVGAAIIFDISYFAGALREGYSCSDRHIG